MKILSEPEKKELNARTVACVSFVGNYVGNPAIFEELFGKLCDWGFQNQIMEPDTVFIAAYYDDPNVTPPDELTLDVCMTIPEGIKVEGEVQKKNLPGGTYAVMGTELTGPEEYPAAWGKVVEWAMKNSLEIDLSRASYEIYLNNPEEHPEKHHILDICLAVK